MWRSPPTFPPGQMVEVPDDAPADLHAAGLGAPPAMAEPHPSAVSGRSRPIPQRRITVHEQMVPRQPQALVTVDAVIGWTTTLDGGW